MSKTALLLVDIQRDFMDGGSLAVPFADEIIMIANKMMSEFDYVIATVDWHPNEHISFLQWPKHCVQFTPGAAFADGLNIGLIDKVFTKGADHNTEEYSGINCALLRCLDEEEITNLVVMGVATEYCVKNTVLTALKSGLKVQVYLPGCRGINKNDIFLSLGEMEVKGAELVKEDFWRGLEINQFIDSFKAAWLKHPNFKFGKFINDSLSAAGILPEFFDTTDEKTILEVVDRFVPGAISGEKATSGWTDDEIAEWGEPNE